MGTHLHNYFTFLCNFLPSILKMPCKKKEKKSFQYQVSIIATFLTVVCQVVRYKLVKLRIYELSVALPKFVARSTCNIDRGGKITGCELLLSPTHQCQRDVRNNLFCQEDGSREEAMIYCCCMTKRIVLEMPLLTSLACLHNHFVRTRIFSHLYTQKLVASFPAEKCEKFPSNFNLSVSI